MEKMTFPFYFHDDVARVCADETFEVTRHFIYTLYYTLYRIISACIVIERSNRPTLHAVSQ